MAAASAREMPRVALDEGLIAASKRERELSIIGQILGPRVEARILVSRLPTLWRLKGSFQMLELRNGFFVFSFELEEDWQHVRAGAPWPFAGQQQLLVTKWVPNFDPDTAFITVIPVWVILPNLPIEFWKEEILKRMVEPVGQFIKQDEVTSSGGRIGLSATFARVLVEVDLGEPLPTGVSLQLQEGSRYQKLLYENLPVPCKNCERVSLCSPCSFCKNGANGDFGGNREHQQGSVGSSGDSRRSRCSSGNRYPRDFYQKPKNNRKPPGNPASKALSYNRDDDCDIEADRSKNLAANATGSAGSNLTTSVYYKAGDLGIPTTSASSNDDRKEYLEAIASSGASSFSESNKIEGLDTSMDPSEYSVGRLSQEYKESKSDARILGWLEGSSGVDCHGDALTAPIISSMGKDDDDRSNDLNAISISAKGSVDRSIRAQSYLANRVRKGKKKVPSMHIETLKEREAGDLLENHRVGTDQYAVRGNVKGMNSAAANAPATVTASMKGKQIVQGSNPSAKSQNWTSNDPVGYAVKQNDAPAMSQPYHGVASLPSLRPRRANIRGKKVKYSKVTSDTSTPPPTPPRKRKHQLENLHSKYHFLLGLIWKKKSEKINIDAFIKTHGNLFCQRYNYSELKKSTRSFKDKLGEGGYGSVFKGKLKDGTLVAVKVLKNIIEEKQFINELVASTIHHANITHLLGFCCEGSIRALMYEFMSKGPLDKYIYAKDRGTIPPLSLHKRLEIAIGIARGLEHLHRYRIIHSDIKPENILLDDDLCPKIADFGLARTFSNSFSLVRGTIGYIAPEIICNTDRVSVKSDVYSYGMTLLEMIAGRKNNDSNDEYFPHWAYEHIRLDRGLASLGYETTVEQELAKKMALVGLYCIQRLSMMRPTMSEVIEMLEGTLEGLQMPSKSQIFELSPRG